MRKKARGGCVGRIGYKGLITDVAQRTGYNQETVSKIIRATFDSIKQLMFDRIAVNIANFGVFYLTKNKSTVYYVPYHDTMLKVFRPMRYIPRFMYARNFRKQIAKVIIPEIPESE